MSEDDISWILPIAVIGGVVVFMIAYSVYKRNRHHPDNNNQAGNQVVVVDNQVPTQTN